MADLGSTRRRRSASSGRTEYNTPASVVFALSGMGGIELDPCWNERCITQPRRYYTEIDDGLAQAWDRSGIRVNYVNPPYGHALKLWAAKIDAEYLAGAEVVSLVPNSTETRWYATLTERARAECRISGRLTFGGEKTPAFFGSVLVYHGRRVALFEQACASLGRVVRLTPEERAA